MFQNGDTVDLLWVTANYKCSLSQCFLMKIVDIWSKVTKKADAIFVILIFI